MSSPPPETTWYSVKLIPDQKPHLLDDDIQSLALELSDSTGAPSEILENGQILCYVTAKEQVATHILPIANAAQYKIENIALVSNEQVHTNCAEIWEKLDFESFKIIPISDQESAPHTKDENDILIIPGTGFGTGHHSTTHMVLELLCNVAKESRLGFERILDFGTGSAVLAIAAQRLFGYPVDAIDNDPLALENAQTNIHINKLASNINCSTKTLSELNPPYQLILANVYSEVLANSEPELARLIAPGGILLISGFGEISEPLLADKYLSGERWIRHNRVSRAEWCAWELERISV